MIHVEQATIPILASEWTGRRGPLMSSTLRRFFAHALLKDRTMTASPATRPAPSVFIALLPIMTAVFVVFFITGIALPVLPLHVHEGLGHSTFIVGLIVGAQFAASLLSRVFAGSYSDRHGPKRAVLVGLVLSAIAGLLYLASLLFLDNPVLSVVVILIGRGVFGGAESFVITGAQSWGLALASSENAGKAISWVGTAMYAAMALGAPVGSLLFGGYGFVSVGLVTLLVPLVALLAVAPMRPVAPHPQAKGALGKVLRAVWLPGFGMSFSSLGFGVMSAFAVLQFVERGWEPAWLAFTAFATAFIAARLLLGHLSDRFGGARVALVFAAVESLGLGLVWFAPWPALGFLGAALVGFGYSLVYPGLGLEAVRRAPPESRGLAMGIYTAFLDVALGILGPILGLVAVGAGLGSVFLVSAILVLCTLPVAAWLLTHPPRGH
jgi:MFS family permease